MIESADDEPHLHCLTSSYVFIFPACKLTRDSWLVTCIGMQNEEKSTQFTMPPVSNSFLIKQFSDRFLVEEAGILNKQSSDEGFLNKQHCAAWLSLWLLA